MSTADKALVSDQGLRRGAGEKNRTRALNLGVLVMRTRTGRWAGERAGRTHLGILAKPLSLTAVHRALWNSSDTAAFRSQISDG